MINVFKNRTRLCAVTTSVFFFLQGVDASMGTNGIARVDSEVGQQSCDSGYQSYKSTLFCLDGEKHTIKRGNFSVENPGGNAIITLGRLVAVGKTVAVDTKANNFITQSFIVQDFSDLTKSFDRVSDNSIEDKGIAFITENDMNFSAMQFRTTTVKVSDSVIIGSANFKNHSTEDYEEDHNGVNHFSSPGYGSAVFAAMNGVVELERTNIRGVTVGIETQIGGKSIMKDAHILRSWGGVLAFSDSSVVLENVVVGTNRFGLYGYGGGITMKSGSIMIEEGGVGVISENNSTVVLKNVAIKGREKELRKADAAQESGVESIGDTMFESTGLLSNGGFIAFDNGTFNDSNTIFLRVRDNFLNTDSAISQISRFVSVSSVDGDKSEPQLTGFSDVVSTMQYVSDNLNQNSSSDWRKRPWNERAWKLSASMKKSNIDVKGRGSSGIYFGEAVEKKENEAAKQGARVVFLEGTTLNVPDGVAAHSNNMNGYIVLGKKSRLSGDMLLKVEPNSTMSVFAHDSTLIGGVSLASDARAELFLSGKSMWGLTKSKHNNLDKGQDDSYPDCKDSCISFVHFADSSIKFYAPKNGEDYQTLRVGKGSGTVYIANGDSGIYFNARIASSDSGAVLKSDQLLIYGNVSGTTKVYVNEAVNRTRTDDRVSISENDKYHSVSIIQVHGTATKDSFKLGGGYITIPGSPYQYTLRAYSPQETQDFGYGQYFANRFENGKKNEEVWDFRLENKLENEHVLSLGAGVNKLFKNELSVKATPSSGETSTVPARFSHICSNSEDEEIIVTSFTYEGRTFDCSKYVKEGDESTITSGTSTLSVTPSVVSTLSSGSASINSDVSGDSLKVIRLSSKSLSRSEEDDEINMALPSTDSATFENSETSEIDGVSSKLDSSSVGSNVSQNSAPVGRILLFKGPAPIISSAATVQPAVPATPAVFEVSTVAENVVSSECDNTERNGARESQISYSCSDGKPHTKKNPTLRANNNTQHSVRAKNKNTIINLESATVIGAHSSDNKNNVDLTKLQPVSAVLAEEGAEVVLNKKSTLQSSLIGLEAQRGGKVKMDDGTISAHYVGVLADSGSSINLSDTQINVEGPLAVAGLASRGGEITMNSGLITLAKGVAVRSEMGGNIKLNKVNITLKKRQGQSDDGEMFGRSAFLLSDGGSVDLTNGNVVTDAHGVWVGDTDDVVKRGSSRNKRSSDVRPSVNRANIEFSTITVEGDRSYGIYFDGTVQRPVNEQNQVTNRNPVRQTRSVEPSALPLSEKALTGMEGMVSLKKTVFEVLKSIAVYGNNSSGRVSLENKATLSGDLLLKAENNSNIWISVDNSIIVGGARVDRGSYAKLDLTNESEWHLKRSAHKSLSASDSECIDSCVSSVSLVNSFIEFAPLESQELKYQTLRIGEGKGTVYKAQGNAAIYLNARLSPGDSDVNQLTDRLLIHGDVSGKTVVYVRGVAGNTSEKDQAHSVSIIQVYGKAQKDSFQLSGDYVTLANSPYKYTLRSYGPEATSAQDHVHQKFMENGGDFWNFRLENQYVKPSSFAYTSAVSKVGFSSYGERVVRSVVPQVPTYLLLPNSVFHAGLMDINNQNKQLEILRTTSSGKIEARENPALYLRGYSGSYRYASDLSALEYGYKGDLNYNGVEAGVLLHTIENADTAISFGVMGTYGKLALQPVDVEQSQKSAFDKWTVTAYGSMQHDTGFYVDGLFSYGLFKGDVLTLARGKTATLKGSPLSASLIGGKAFATGYEGFIFDPQVQVVYQHLHFDKARDIDNFDIEMGKLDQWVARVGGRLIKTPTGVEGVRAVAFYSKLYLAHGFGGKQSVHFKDAFQLGAFGSSLEAGLGFNAKLSSAFSLHGDVVYQHQLNKAGFSGASFSGGVRYQF